MSYSAELEGRQDWGGRSVVLNRYVSSGRLAESDFSVVPSPSPDGDVVLETLALSVDPYLRSCMTGVETYFLPQFRLGEPPYSMGVGRVLSSRVENLRPGDVVTGVLDWSDCSGWTATDRMAGAGAELQPVDPRIGKMSHVLGALGLNGITAFFGVLAVARPRPRETFLISGAAGGVGTIAGQIARIEGARVIGLAGSAAKCRVLVEQLGFDAALDYHSENLASELLALAPGGVDVYFDNVGGGLSQTVMATMRRPGRVIECGQIATYDDPDGGWSLDIRPIHSGSLRFESFTPLPFLEYYPGALAQLAHWIDSGRLIVLETEYEGLESAPRALVELFRGGNIGKSVVNVAIPT